MRSSTAAAIGLCLIVATGQPAVSQTTAPSSPPTPSTPAETRQPVTGDGQSDAAEKHAKRTECLQDAKLKKLVGAQKTAFLKDCISAAADKPAAASGRVSPLEGPGY